MKKVLLIITAMFIILSIIANPQSIQLDSSRTESNLLSSSNKGIDIEFNVSSLNWFEVETSKGLFTEINIDSYTHTNKVGFPKLPMERKIIEVPLGAKVVPEIKVINSRTFNLSEYGINSRIIPDQPSIAKSVDPTSIEFVINENAYTVYNRNQELVQVKELGILRNARLFTVDYYPVDYNPVNGDVTVITESEVHIEFVNSDMNRTNALKARTASYQFENLIKNFAFSTLETSNRNTLNRYPLGYIIVTPANFVSTLQPFIDWKTEQGFQVTVATTDVIGTTTSAISNYISGIWNASTTEHPAPTYLLIVGDVAQVPAFNGQTESHITDLNYVKLQGNDYLPEMYFGRFSAQNVSQLQPQVDKTLMYEKYLMPDPSYLDNVVLIAGMDDNYGPSHGNGAINYGSQNYFNASHGLNATTYFYPSSGNSASSIISNVSNGVGYINYTAHGDTQEWYSPNFDNSDINGLQNSGKYTFAVGNCCLTNHFQTDTCFGEAWLRANDKGAIVYISGTNSTYWDEDYWWAVGNKPITGSGTPWIANHIGVYDGMFHEHDEAYDNWVTTAGSMTFMGNMAVVQGNGSSNYYWEIYSIMGDPSLSPYIGQAETQTTSVPSQVFIGQTNMLLNVAPHAYIALTNEGQIIATDVADGTGYVSFDFPAITTAGNVKLVSTSFGYQPYETTIQVIPNDGPYLNISSFNIDEATSINAGSEVRIDFTVANIGNAGVSNITAVLSSEDQYVTITNNIIDIPIVSANDEFSIEDAFTVRVSSNIPDGHNIRFSVSMGDHNNSWISNVTLQGIAPKFELSNFSFTESNGDGALDPGENATINITVSNTGHMVAENARVDFIVSNPLVTVPVTSNSIGSLAVGGDNTTSFAIQLDDSFDSAGIVFGISVSADCGDYIENYLIPVGLSGDSFESGDFSTLNWTMNGNSDWQINTQEIHDGNYSAKSGTISNNGSTSMSATVDIVVAGDISFWYKVSSESNYDWLEFYDGTTRVQRWSGEAGWSQFIHPVSAGTHTFTWKYDKDWSDSDGTDCAWIDDIIMPGSATGGTSMPILYCTQNTIEFTDIPANEESSREFVIQNAGNEVLNGSVILPQGFDLEGEQNYTIESGESKVFSISHTPVAGEELTDTITITSNDPNNNSMTITVTVSNVTGIDGEESLPLQTALNGNFPNPFNPTTNISFALKKSSNISIDIYNILGQKVTTLINEYKLAGNYSITWEGTDSNNHKVASGVYFYRMKTDNYTNTKKMLLMK